jgi:hypothetical protein
MATTLKTPAAVALTTTAQDIYTCPASTSATVVFCQITNIDGTSSVDSYVSWTDASNANAENYLAYKMNVPAAAAITPIGGKMVLEAGDKIRAKAASNSIAVITLSVMEAT